MASLYDVAARAGVSKTLVSRVINDQPGVSAKSKAKILTAMEELQYVPNALARSLVLQKTGVIGVVLDSLCETYFFELIRGIEDAIAQSDYDVLFCSGKSDVHLKERKINFFSQGRTDGVIIYGSELSDIGLIQKMATRPFPFVVVENEVELEGICSIVVDNVKGAQMAVDHLAGLGCRNIWHFTGDMERTISLSRHEGYRKGMAKNHLPFSEHMIVESGFGEKMGYLQMKQLIKDNRDYMPDGIFFSADITAFGALRALMEEGVDVPDKIKIVGFDNDDPHKTDAAVLPLTTLNQPLYEMGMAAANILLDAIAEPGTKKEKHIFYPELIIRQSTVSKK